MRTNLPNENWRSKPSEDSIHKNVSPSKADGVSHAVQPGFINGVNKSGNMNVNNFQGNKHLESKQSIESTNNIPVSSDNRHDIRGLEMRLAESNLGHSYEKV